MTIHWKDGCWSWRSNTLAIWYKEQTHWKRLILGNIEGRRRREQQRIRWLDSISDSMHMYLSKLQEIEEDKGAWHAVVHGVTKNQTWLSSWTTAICSNGKTFGDKDALIQGPCHGPTLDSPSHSKYVNSNLSNNYNIFQAERISQIIQVRSQKTVMIGSKVFNFFLKYLIPHLPLAIKSVRKGY